MNLNPKFIVVGILVALSIGVLEGAPCIKTTEKLPCTITTETTEPQCESKPESSETPETLPESKECDSPIQPETSSLLSLKPLSLPPPKPNLVPPPKPCLCGKIKPCSGSPKPVDCGAEKPVCHNIFSHFYGYFSWMAQFYKWVEKYGKWMAGGVNHMFS